MNSDKMMQLRLLIVISNLLFLYFVLSTIRSCS